MTLYEPTIMQLRDIVKWETTPKELRRVADEMERGKGEIKVPIKEADLRILFSESKWLKEQGEEK